FAGKVGLSSGEVPAPVFGIDTCPVDPVAFAGWYRTAIVQLLPGLMAAPFTQVVPAPATIENAPFAPPAVAAIVGVPVIVSGAVAAAALLPVMVPFFWPVPPPFSAGVGPVNVTVAPVTVNAPVKVLVAPAGVVALTLRAPSAAPLVIVQFASIVV